MDNYEATERDYKNGYEQGKKDALKWISVKDKYPNHGDVVLICTKGKDVQVFQWDEVYGGWVGDRYNYSTKYVTHWQYLPQPPKGE